MKNYPNGISKDKRNHKMGILKNLTDEYFGKTLRKEDLDVEIVSFTDENNKFHEKGFRIKEMDSDEMAKTLSKLIDTLIKRRGYECDLNDIDVSNIEKMFYIEGVHCYGVFYKSNFNGDISGWNVQNVKSMVSMFFDSKFTGKNGMFKLKEGNKVERMNSMFYESDFNVDISDWKVNNITEVKNMFVGTPVDRKADFPQWYLDKQ